MTTLKKGCQSRSDAPAHSRRSAVSAHRPSDNAAPRVERRVTAAWPLGLLAATFAGAVILGPLAAKLYAADLSKVSEMFHDICSRCHGPDGFGDGPDGRALSTTPRNFHDCTLMARDSDDKVFNEIKGGSASIGRSNDMPSWGEALSDDEIHDLVAYVRHFCAGK